MTVFIDAHIRREIKEIHFFLFFLQKLSIFHLKELFHIFLCFFFFFSQKLEKENLNLNINLITIDHQFTFILLQFFQNSVLEYLITQYEENFFSLTFLIWEIFYLLFYFFQKKEIQKSLVYHIPNSNVIYIYTSNRKRETEKETKRINASFFSSPGKGKKKREKKRKKKKKKINRFEKNLGSVTIFILTHGGTERAVLGRR